MVRYSESQLQEAMQAVTNGMPIKKAGREYGVLPTTLKDCLSGSISREQRDKDQRLLSEYQEDVIAKWALVQASLGCAPTHRALRLVALGILQAAGKDHKLGKHWTTKFLRRHPEVKTLQGKPIDLVRVKGVEPDKIKALFQYLDQPFIRTIRAQNRWNFDESGFQEGFGTNGKVIGPSEGRNGQKVRYALVKGSQRKDWITIIEAINAEGNQIPPVVIFKGASVQAQWFPIKLEEFKTWKFSSSPNGWTSNDLGLAWLTSHFLPLTAPGKKDWRLLILDGHDSHVSDEFLIACCVGRVYLCLLPCHSSHVTQPLDVAVFSPAKRYYRRFLENFGHEEYGSASAKQHFLEAYVQARHLAFSRRNILSAWKATGLWPVDANQALNNPFVLNAAPKTPPKAEASQKESSLQISTPSHGLDLKKLAVRTRHQVPISERIQRDILRKAAKALDKKNAEISVLQTEKRLLEIQVEDLRPKKRKKVAPDLGKRFVQIAQIQAVQQLGEVVRANNIQQGAQDEITLHDSCIDF